MIRKSLICGVVGAAVVGFFHLIGADLVVSLVIALFIMVIVATVILNGRSQGGTESEPEFFNARSSISDRTGAGDPD